MPRVPRVLELADAGGDGAVNAAVVGFVVGATLMVVFIFSMKRFAPLANPFKAARCIIPGHSIKDKGWGIRSCRRCGCDLGVFP